MKDRARHTKRRLTALLVALPLLSGALVFFTLSQQQIDAVKNEQFRFGKSTARQLANRVAGDVVEKNTLSLNVLVTRLTRDEPLEFVAIYDESNRLLAQSGKDTKNNDSYTAEVTFQDSLAGRVRVTVAQTDPGSPWPGAMLLLLAAIYGLLAWRFTTRISDWIDDRPETPSTVEDETLIPEEIEDGTSEECILVVRIRPARHLERHFNKFYQAANLYRGIVEQTTPEELVIHFDSPDAMYMATCAGLLIQKVADRLTGKIAFGGTLDLLDKEPEKARKAASYLASIAEGNLLIAGGDGLLSDRVDFQSFHHALVDSKGLLRIAGINNADLLNSQAIQLTTQG